MIGMVCGIATSNPSDDTSLTVVDAVGMCQNRNWSRARPKSGATTRTETTKEGIHMFQCGPYWLSRSKTNADTKACAPNAMLKTPVARKVITSPTAMSAYSQPVGMPGMRN